MYLWSLWRDVDNATSILSLYHTFCYDLTDIDHCLHIHSKRSATKAWESTWSRFSSSHNILLFFTHPAFHHYKPPTKQLSIPGVLGLSHQRYSRYSMTLSTKIYTVWCSNSILFHSFIAYSLCTRTGDNKIHVTVYVLLTVHPCIIL